MKAVIFISTLIVILALGIASFYFFMQSEYYISALLTIGTYLSLGYWVSKVNDNLLANSEWKMDH